MNKNTKQNVYSARRQMATESPKVHTVDIKSNKEVPLDCRLHKSLLIIGALTLSSNVWASKEKIAQLVPNSKVVSEEENEFEVLTPQNTAIEIEFNSEGALEEASGDAAQTGDVFTPGEGRVPLAGAVDSLKKAGKTITGEWEFDKSLASGWVYEFEGTEDGKKMEYTVNASDGKIIRERKDW